jgi:hypothetical protein
MPVLIRSYCLITVLLACTPTDPCACLQAPGLVVVTGTVERADSTPAVEALTWFQTYSDTVCLVPRLKSSPTAVDGAGRYLHTVITGAPARECLGIFAARPAAGGLSDSVLATRVHTYTYREPPDTLAIPVLRLP